MNLIGEFCLLTAELLDSCRATAPGAATMGKCVGAVGVVAGVARAWQKCASARAQRWRESSDPVSIRCQGTAAIRPTFDIQRSGRQRLAAQELSPHWARAPASAHEQHELAADVASLAEPVGLGNLVERERLCDGEREPPGLDQLADVLERVHRPLGVRVRAGAKAHASRLGAGVIGDRDHVPGAAGEVDERGERAAARLTTYRRDVNRALAASRRFRTHKGRAI
jgi:hypothetical protein